MADLQCFPLKLIQCLLKFRWILHVAATGILCVSFQQCPDGHHIWQKDVWNAVTHEISRETVATKQHIKAAILMRAGALFAILFASAEQDAEC